MNVDNEEKVFNFDLSLEDRLDKYITKYFYIAKIILYYVIIKYNMR